MAHGCRSRSNIQSQMQVQEVSETCGRPVFCCFCGQVGGGLCTGNGIYDDGISGFARALEVNKTLTSLNLQGMRCPD